MSIRVHGCRRDCGRGRHPCLQSMRKHAYVASASFRTRRTRTGSGCCRSPPAGGARRRNRRTRTRLPKNHWLSAGAISRISRMKKPNCLAGSSARCVSGSDAAPARRSRPGPGSAAGSARRRSPAGSPGTPSRPRTPRAPGRRTAAVSTSNSTASTMFANGPARLTSVCCRGVIHDVRTYTAPPGRPMPPSAMNSIGRPSDSSGLRVLQRVERQVAAHRDVVVAEPPCGEGVARTRAGTATPASRR